MQTTSTQSSRAKNAKSKAGLNNLVIFDFDGVLFDAFDNVWRTLQPIFRRHNFRRIRTPQEFRNLFDQNFYAATEKRGLDICHTPALKKEIANAMTREYHPPLHHGMASIVRQLSTKYTLAVESSNFERAMKRMLRKHGMLRFFTAIAGADRQAYKGTRMRTLVHTLKPAQTLFVTDTAGDVVDARKAGIPTIGVTWGYQSYHQLKKAKPLSIARTPQQLLKKIRAFFTP
ncbi:HAD hydrolase-like protein [Candidatus Woesearchaeota archaeon]|nr:HAD hydrolase-like protein [Candidatus Woesearchaeota archaeon]